MFSPVGEAVRAMEEWVSAVQFTYLGGGEAHQQHRIFELSNRVATSTTSSAGEDGAAAESLPAEQLVEILVRVLQTGMRRGLRGALEVIKILDRLPEAVIVPVATDSFGGAALAQASPFFRSMEDAEAHAPSDERLNSNSNSNHNATSDATSSSSSSWRERFTLVTLPMKAVRGALFVVNQCASDSDSALCRTPGAQLRMFLRMCLQQRCLLLVVELLVGFLRANDGALADFLYVHRTATPLLDDGAFHQLLECVRRIGGPPLVVRAVAHMNGLSIAPLLESPWDPVECGADAPIIASWSMWFAAKGLRLRWQLEYNVPADGAHPDYVAEQQAASSHYSTAAAAESARGAGAGAYNGSTSTPKTGRSELDDTSAGGAGDVGAGGRRIVRRVVTTKRRAGGGPFTSPGSDSATRNPSSSLMSPRPDDMMPPSEVDVRAATSTASPSSSRRASVTLPVHSDGNTHQAARPPISSSNSSFAATDAAAARVRTVSDSEIAAAVAAIESQTAADCAAVTGTIARWQSEASRFRNGAGVSDAVQPLLEAYAALVYADWSRSLGCAALAESRLMECHDSDAGGCGQTHQGSRAARSVDSDSSDDGIGGGDAW